MRLTSPRREKSRSVLFIGRDRSDFDAVEQHLRRQKRVPMHAHWEKRVTSALRSLETRSFDAILLDASLPDGKGIESLQALQAAAPSAPIMLISSQADETGRSAQGRAEDNLTKGPLEVRLLFRTLDSLIDRKITEEALLAEKERAEITLDSIGDGVLCADVFGHVTYLNPTAEKMTGWSCADATGRPAACVLRIIDGITRKPVPDPLQLAIRRDMPMALATNSILIRRDGFESPIEDSVAPIRDRTGRVTGAVAVFHDVSEARAAALKLTHQAQHDFLTDLPNRAVFNDRLIQAIAMARRHRRKLAVLFLDCDKFKEINDALGHTTGDLLLQSVAKRLVSAGRSSDTVSRRGGDEFVILLPELEEAEDAGLCAKKILKALAMPHRIGQQALHVTASIGLAVYPADGRNAEALIQAADVALYEAKQQGGNNYRSFSRRMKTRAIERQSLEGSLLRALERKEFRLHYQPRMNLTTGAVVGVEALLRWDHPERGLVLPAAFVPIAEDSGLIVPIGRWVLDEACRQARTWRAAGFGVMPMAVNVSAVEFGSAGFLKGITDLLAGDAATAGTLELELNERVLLQDTETIGESLQALTDMGVRVALDDFGTGFSSLACLQRFPISRLKIDRSFVREMTSGAGDTTLVAAIIGLGRSLGRTVIAEGIETVGQLDLLRGLSCDEGQGFHFCRPLPADDFAAYLEHAGPT